jgi:arylsulfatase
LADAITKDDLAELDRGGWELFDVATDFSESHNVAEAHPDKLKEMIALWWSEAKKYNVLPVDGTMGQRINTDRPAVAEPRDKFVFYPGAPVPLLAQPNIYNRSYVITADVNIPSGGAEGVIVAAGSTTGGYSLYVKDGKVGYIYNYLALKKFQITDDTPVPEGDVNIVYEFEATGKPDVRNGKGAPGTGKLFVNRKQVGEVDMDVTVPLIFSAEGLSCGRDYGDSVDKETYKPPFKFTGTIKQVTFDLSGDAIQDAEAEHRRAMAKQ